MKSFIVLILPLLLISSVFGQTPEQSRVIVLTDIEADPDDSQTLVRMLLYANQIDIRGIIATTSVHQKSMVAPQTVERIIRAYGQVQRNLEAHEKGYPRADELMALVKSGLPVYGMQGVGENHDSEGSAWIIQELEKDDDRPLWISVWGGVNTLAQALYRLDQSRSKSEVRRMVAKLRVYTISDQDDSGIWIRKNFPGLFYVVSPGGYQHATWLGINRFIPGIDNTTISNSWLAVNIQQGHGPLCEQYPDVGYGMEGDTPSWLWLIPNGLNVPEHPDWGGWGGRYAYYKPDHTKLDGFNGGVPIEEEPHAIWTNASDRFSPYVPNEYGRSVRKDTTVYEGNQVTIWRWRDDIQNDFAARMDWCLKTYEEANHPPVPALGHADRITVKAGELFHLDASGTSDPDGDNLSYLWFHYPEVGTYDGIIQTLAAENLYRVAVVAPEVDKAVEAHFILRVTDKGTPALSRYKRVIVTIEP